MTPPLSQKSAPAEVVFADSPTGREVGDKANPKPICFVVDADPAIRRTVSSVVAELGVRVEEFDGLAPMLDAAASRQPNVIFFDAGLVSDDPDEIAALGIARIRAPVQLMSGLNAVLSDHVRRTGERYGVRMLPVLDKPFRPGAIKRVVSDLGLGRDGSLQREVGLAEALRRGWLEVWYQPKIDLRAKQLAGAEAYARIRHPDHGVMPPASFLSNAEEAELLMLAEHVITTALRDWTAVADLGAPVKFAFNIPIAALHKLPLADMLGAERPKSENWPGLILEITEDEVLPNLGLARDAARQLGVLGVKLAVDDFGAGYGALAQLSEIPFCELKIDRSHVADCHSDGRNAGLCESVIELAHRFGIAAVAEGIETAAELKALQGMNCDLGQGFLFARPLPKSEFAELLRARKGGKAVRQPG